MRVLLIASILLSTVSHAKGVNAPVTYLVSGKIVTAEQALNAALGKQEVFKCQVVELKPSKSGTSFSLRAKKVESTNTDTE